MQNRNTWVAHPVSPCQHGCGNHLPRPSQVPTAPDQGDRGRGREKQVTPAHSLSSSLGQTFVYLQTAGGGGWTCKHHQEASWLGSTRSLEQGIWGHGYGLPAKLVSCLIPSGDSPRRLTGETWPNL